MKALSCTKMLLRGIRVTEAVVFWHRGCCFLTTDSMQTQPALSKPGLSWSRCQAGLGLTHSPGVGLPANL